MFRTDVECMRQRVKTLKTDEVTARRVSEMTRLQLMLMLLRGFNYLPNVMCFKAIVLCEDESGL